MSDILNEEQICRICGGKSREDNPCSVEPDTCLWLTRFRGFFQAQHDYMVNELGYKSPEQVRELVKQERERVKTELEKFFLLKMNTDTNTKVTFYKEHWKQFWQSLKSK